MPRDLLTTPADISSESLSFIKTINAEFEPFYINVKPGAGSVPNECFSNVDDYVTQHGGQKVIGWQIWEWPGIFAEAELHAVWKSAEGEYLDVTPKAESKILFLPDPKSSFTGSRVNNVRVALLETEMVSDFIAIGDAKHAIFGSLPNGTALEFWQQGIMKRLDAGTALLMTSFPKGAKPNKACPCKSGMKYQD